MMDWKDGDKALCIKGGKLEGNVGHVFPQFGYIYTVKKERPWIFSSPNYEGKALIFYDAPKNNNGKRMWAEFRFIKLPELTEEEIDMYVVPILEPNEL